MPLEEANQNLPLDIIFKLFHIYSLLGIMDENGCHKHFCFQKIEILEQLKLILGAFLVWCSKIIELGFNEKFIRTWEYYFDYCAAGFKTHTLGNYQVPLYTITISTQLI